MDEMDSTLLEDIMMRGTSVLLEHRTDAPSPGEVMEALDAIFRDMTDEEVLEVVHAVRKEVYCHGARAE